MVSFETLSPFHISSSISRPITPLRRGLDIYSASDSFACPPRVWTPSPSPSLSLGARSPIGNEYHVTVESSRLYDYQPAVSLNARWAVAATDTSNRLSALGALSSLSPRKVELVKATGLVSPMGFRDGRSAGPSLPGSVSPSPSASKRWMFAARAAFRQHKIRVQRELESIENYDSPVFVSVSRQPIGLRSAMRSGRSSCMRESAKRVQFARAMTVSVFSTDNPPLSLKSCDTVSQGDGSCAQPATTGGIEQPVPTMAKATVSEPPLRLEQNGSLQMRPGTPVPTGRGPQQQLPVPSAFLPKAGSVPVSGQSALEPSVLPASYVPAQPITPREETAVLCKERRSGYMVPSLRACTPPNRPSSSAIITPPASVRRESRPAPVRLPAGGRQIAMRTTSIVSAQSEPSVASHNPPAAAEGVQPGDVPATPPASPSCVDPDSPPPKRKRTAPKTSPSKKKSCRTSEEAAEARATTKVKKKPVRQQGAEGSVPSPAKAATDGKRDKPRKRLERKEGKISSVDSPLVNDIMVSALEGPLASSLEASTSRGLRQCQEPRLEEPGSTLVKHEGKSTNSKAGKGTPRASKVQTESTM